MSTEPKDTPPILVKGTLDASPETVHAALTDADLLKRWYSAWAGCEITSASADVRRGGTYRIEARTKYGTERYVKGEFLYVSPDRIVITWAADYSTGFDSTVFFFLEPSGSNATTLSVEHRGLRNVDERKQTEEGWTHVLAIMRRGLPRLDESRTPFDVEEFLKRSETRKEEGSKHNG